MSRGLVHLKWKSSGMGCYAGYFWFQLIFICSHLCRRWIFPLAQLEPSLFSMTTLLEPRHGAHVPFHLVAAQLSQPCPQGGRQGGSRCWGEGLAGAPESSSLILCLEFTAVTGTLTATQRSWCPPDFGLQCSLTWCEGRAEEIQGQGCQSRPRAALELQSCA